MILDGKKVRDEILNNVKQQIIDNNLDLTLAIILIGSDGPSKVYVNNKLKYCSMVGIKTQLYEYENIEENKLIDLINELNNDSKITGIIIQSPVPNNINYEKCVNMINPLKDVDGFTKENFYHLFHNEEGIKPCTAIGIINLLKYYNISLESKKVTIIGRGNMVGKPLIALLLNENASVSVCHSKTTNLKDYTLNSDIIVLGVGKQNILTEDMINNDVIVIDAGISVIDGKVKGDADFNNIKDKCKYITPTPGGVGPMTIAMIIKNTLECYYLQNK